MLEQSRKLSQVRTNIKCVNLIIVILKMLLADKIIASFLCLTNLIKSNSTGQGNSRIKQVSYLVTLQLDSIKSFSKSSRLEGILYSNGDVSLFKRNRPTQNFAPISSNSRVPICKP